MRILHISDLHFGKHNQALGNSLLRKISKLEIDVIVCTGDLADGPKRDLWNQAKQFLSQAEAKCSGRAAPRLIVVPGNHDYQLAGFAGKITADNYEKEWAGYNTEIFYKFGKANVWIFAFNSAEEGELGGSGRIQEEEIARFHARYDELSNDPDFANSFKIVAVHHHPLPVNWNHDFRAKWLTMVNSGQFLSPVLFRKVDLILHGHEHLQARAGFWSTLGDSQHKISVVSLGATLRQMDNGKQNWFGIVTIEENKAGVEFYYNVGMGWSEKPEPATFLVRTEEATQQATWDQQVQKAGYAYREVASITLLDNDGDARRVVECRELTIKASGNPRAKEHKIELAPTSGYLASLTTKGNGRLKVSVEKPIPPLDQDHHSWDSTLRFEPAIQVGAEHAGSYQYSWYAVNSFALDELQFEYKYDRARTPLWNVEYTHYPVIDPIEHLTVVVQFPEGFRPGEPRIRVAQIQPDQPDSRQWETDSEVYARLDSFNAIRYYESLRSAALRVRRPQQGLSYGIEWDVPEAQAAADESIQGVAQELWDIWRSGAMTEEQRKSVIAVICRVFAMTRDVFAKDWSGPLVGSFMYLETDSRLPMLAGVRETKGADGDYQQVELRYDTQLRYGTGIGGRAFKTNSMRVYVAPVRANRGDAPVFYRHVPGSPVHKVLVSFPVHVPVDASIWDRNHHIYKQKRPYGILNIGSERADCPMSNLRLPEKVPDAMAVQHNINLLLFEAFREIFLRAS